jgi:hypothetical protein
MTGGKRITGLSTGRFATLLPSRRFWIKSSAARHPGIDAQPRPRPGNLPAGTVLFLKSTSLRLRGLGNSYLLFAVICLHVCPTLCRAAQTTLNFTLAASCTTSAGVYTEKGVLVRTLWRAVPYSAGTHQANWDGKEDNGSVAPNGQYTFKILYHHVKYQWDGVIGNTSQADTGPTVHRAGGLPTAYATASLSSGKTRIYYAAGYNEQQSPFHRFDVDPANTETQQIASDMFNSDNRKYTPFLLHPDYHVTIAYTVSDSTYVYWANTSSSVNRTRFVLASRVSDDGIVAFPHGKDVYLGDLSGHDPTRIYNTPPRSTPGDYFKPSHWPSCIDVSDATDNGIANITGLEVQRSGPLLFVAHGAMNKIDVLNKSTGQLLNTVDIAAWGLGAPGGMAAIGQDLWVICLKASNQVPTVAKLAITSSNQGTLSNTGVYLEDPTLLQPLSIAASSVHSALLIADGGTQQRIKAFDLRGHLLWAYGAIGGYQTGPAVTAAKFDFGGSFAGQHFFAKSFLAFEPDGSFWVGDTGTYRSLHCAWPLAPPYSPVPAYLSEVMYVPGSYSVGCDANNPSRVFCDFLEFAIPDYAKPLSAYRYAGPVRNWRYQLLANGQMQDMAARYTGYTGSGLQTPVTVTLAGKSHTYTVLNDPAGNTASPYQEHSELFELALNANGMGGLRDTGMGFYRRSGELATQLYPNGAFRRAILKKGAQVYLSRPITSFDSVGNPVLGAETTISSVSDTSPPAGFEEASRLPVTSSNVLAIYSKTFDRGMHLGGLNLADAASGSGQTWRWRSAPTGNLALGLGYYDISAGAQYGGNNALAAGRNIVCGYHGEFWRGGEANQWFHYYDDGLFVGQFGTPSQPAPNQPNSYAAAGFAGNAFSNALVALASGQVYLWHNDESNHSAIHRWHLVNAQNIAEMTGTGTNGGSVTLRP